MKKLMPSRSLPGPHSRVSPNVLPQATRGLAALAEVPHHPYRNGHIHHPVAKVDPRREEFWRNVPTYEHVAAEDFLSYEWGVSLQFLGYSWSGCEITNVVILLG